MQILGIYIYNQTRKAWLQDNEKSWGPFETATEFCPGHEDTAEAIRERETKNDDVTFTMAALH